MKVQMLRNTPVELEQSFNENNEIVVTANINKGQFQHTFPATSRVAKALETMSLGDLMSRMDGGQYFIVNGSLVDFRYNDYNGFIHDDKSIDQLTDAIGIQEQNGPRSRLARNIQSSKYSLGCKWSDHGIDVPGYQEGGDFNSELHYVWNPFHRNIKTAFMLTRLVCENGMMGLSPILNANIPLVNRWREHLDIANRQIQNKVDHRIRTRLSQMGQQRASVGELGLIARHAAKRLEKNNHTQQMVDTLTNIMRMADPTVHLANVYRSSVFEDTRMAAQVPGHLTVFDLFNMATEMRTWTNENAKSSDHALDKFTNSLIFDRKDPLEHVNRSMMPAINSFSDAEAAFWGDAS